MPLSWRQAASCAVKGLAFRKILAVKVLAIKAIKALAIARC
jgi:hypothetical protein